MWQAIATLVILLVIILFGSRNMHETRINFPLAGGVSIHTVFLLIVCYFLGFASASFIWIAKLLKDRKKK